MCCVHKDRFWVPGTDFPNAMAPAAEKDQTSPAMGVGCLTQTSSCKPAPRLIELTNRVQKCNTENKVRQDTRKIYISYKNERMRLEIMNKSELCIGQLPYEALAPAVVVTSHPSRYH